MAAAPMVKSSAAIPLDWLLYTELQNHPNHHHGERKGFLTRHGCCLQSQSNFVAAFPAAFAAKGSLAGLSWGFKPVAGVCGGVEST
jgi:hypothetical protein